MDQLLNGLNERQREAVTIEGGPVLVIAGAGSGKTRVLTHRVAYLIGIKKIPPHRIFVATFTNKAADEMKERIRNLIGADIRDLWIGTFHSLCARILRQEIEKLGTYTRYFTILDRDDQKKVLKEILGDIGEESSKLESLVEKISRYKTGLLITEDQFFLTVYKHYTRKLREYNALDFDDLLILPLSIFNEFPEVLEYYSTKFKHILVDEYQDTNHEQYLLIKALSHIHRNVFVVGDEDQSIYSFRGADIQNILNFEKDFPDCKVIKLEQNYRSTQKILYAASSVIRNNRYRIGKNLWTLNPEGENLVVMETEDEDEEAERVVEIIKSLKRPLGDFLILYRINAQSRALESALQRSGITYKIVGGIKFYERKEIKDILSYLKFLVNPKDSVSLERIINIPPRGIGQETLRVLKERARELDLPLFEVIKAHRELDLNPRIHGALDNFLVLIETLMSKVTELSAYEMVSFLVDEIRYYDYILRSNDPEKAQEKIENVKELIGEIRKFSEENARTLTDYVLMVSLRSDIDEYNASPDFVTLMTVHNAKGLEFPIVIITGLEESIFPHFRSKDNPVELEEERRLFHVALTRAKEKVYITYAKSRYLRRGYLEPSRFIYELPEDVVDFVGKSEVETVIEKYHFKEKKRGEFEPGDLVHHQIFGMGKVVEVYEDKIKVNFFKAGLKTLVLEYAKLERVE
ncbi:MAG: UvrD-helicase domain-containing protein [bacterium]|nr:UvrD-helicase domain-containing protein [bacterium]